MTSLLHDLKLSIRRLRARPASTLVAIVTLSAGIGAVGTMYLLFKASVNELPPVPAAERIGRIFIADPQQRDGRIPPVSAERRRWLDAPPRGVTLAVANPAQSVIEPGGHEVRTLRISQHFFDVAGVGPEIGRPFAPGERGLIVSRRLWDRLPSPVRRLGAMVSVDGDARAIVGVMPAAFWMPLRGVDAWIAGDEHGDEGWPQVLVRLDQGISAEEAAARLSPVVQHVRGRTCAAEIKLLATDAAVRARAGLLMLVGPALLVLLAVSANVSALLLGDVHRRRQELAVRAALGAGRWRLAREVWSDALVIAALGGLVSLAAAYWSIRGLRAAIGSVSPDFAAMMPTFGAVSPVALGAAIVAVLGVGYAPALFASRVNVVSDLTGSGPPLFRKGRYSGADLLLVLQIAMATGLVLWTAAFASVFDRVRAIPPHVPADHLWSVAITARAGAARLAPDLPALVLEHARRAPGIDAAGVAESAGTRRVWNGSTVAADRTRCTAWLERIAGNYFGAHGFPVQGSTPGEAEAVLNQAAVQRCGAPATMREEGAGASLHVVGSVDDRMIGGGIPGLRGPATVYTGLGEPAGRKMTLKIRSRSRTLSEVRALRSGLARAIPAAQFGEPVSFASEHQREFATAALMGKLLFVLAGLSLLFGIVGLHAAIAQVLAARTREIGVRMALGAGRRNVVNLTLAHHAVPALIGILAGVAVAGGGLLLLSTDDAPMIRTVALLAMRSPASWSALLGLLFASTLLSAALPVLRALRVDPAVVLRRN